MKNTTKLLNSYIASLLVWNVKLHNIHWNVTGHLFKPVHEYTEALYPCSVRHQGRVLQDGLLQRSRGDD